MVEFGPSRAGSAAGLRIDAVETLPTDLHTVLVRVAGAWEGQRPLSSDSAVLLLSEGGAEHRVESLPETSGAAVRVAHEDRPFRATFSVPDRLAGLLCGPLELDLGGTRVGLPAPSEATAEASEQTQGTVVDRAVLVERRARRAEVAEGTARWRAQELEQAAVRRESELARLELRLRAAVEERRGLEAQLQARARELRSSRQLAYAEQRLREETMAAADQRAVEAEREASQLRDALARAEHRARALRRELDAIRRQAAEAEQRAQTAMLRARRSDREVTAREREASAKQRVHPDPAVLCRELALASRPSAIIAQLRFRARALGGADKGLLHREHRAAALVLGPVETAGLRERAGRDAQERRDMEAKVSEAHAAVAEAARRLAGERSAHARAETELGERILGFAREANRLRAEVDDHRRAREAAEAELHALARSRSEAVEPAVEIAAVSEAADDGSTESEGAAFAEPPQDAPAEPARELEPTPRPERRWLAIGLQRLAVDHPTSGARLALELLPGQALTSRPVSFDLQVGTLGWHEVTLVPGSGQITPRRRPRGRGDGAAFRIAATPSALVALVTGGSRRLRRRGARVSGTLRRGRALRSLAAVPLDIGALADAGIWIEPLLLHRALAMSIEPEWTRGHRFRLEHAIAGRDGTRCFVTVSDGEPVSVRNRPPAGGVTTTVRTTPEAFARALGAPAEKVEGIEGEGDTQALALLVRWARWGEGVGQLRVDQAASRTGTS